MTTPRLSNSVVAVLVVAAAWATPGHALRLGIFGASGEGRGVSCQGCHSTNTPSPTVEVRGIPADLQPGMEVLLEVSVTKAADSIGTVAGFGLASTSAGIFTDPDPGIDDIRFSNDLLDNQVTHTRPLSYDDNGEAFWRVSLTDLREGRHTLFIGANDGNNNNLATEDRATLLRVPLLVCDPNGADPDGDGFLGRCDLCPTIVETEQFDADLDGIGDVCDNCPNNANANQSDLDSDGQGDVCDAATDECALGVDVCSDNAACFDAPAIGYTCACNAGFVGDGVVCDDVDECADGTDTCDDLATCTNTPGTFTCACNAGYAGDGESCADVDECAEETDTCDDNAACANTDGAFTCACLIGFEGDGQTCTDVDECASEPCAADATCTNTPGDFTCACNAGYEGNGSESCADVDECATGADTCAEQATCTNTAGAFSCACNAGYEGDGATCTDVDECAADPCKSSETCANTDGAFTCTDKPEPKTGCSSTSTASLAPLLSLLLLLRRRRR